jgi:hypothetical protein
MREAKTEKPFMQGKVGSVRPRCCNIHAETDAETSSEASKARSKAKPGTKPSFRWWLIA